MEFFANYLSMKEHPGEWARSREIEGWDGVLCADHYWNRIGGNALPSPHVWVTLSTMAASTSTVRVAPAFANNLLRSPVEFAQASLALHRDSDGRAEAGLGAGWQEDELVATGQRYPDGPTRAAMYREACTIVRELLHEGSCTFAGDHYDVRVPALGPTNASPPPLVAAVGGPWTIRHVTPIADRVELKIGRSTRGGQLDWDALGSVTLAEVQEMVERVREVRDIPIGLLVFVAVGSDERVRAVADKLGDGLFGSFVGEPTKVTESIRALGTVGIDRVHVQEWTKGSIPVLAASLLDRSATGH